MEIRRRATLAHHKSIASPATPGVTFCLFARVRILETTELAQPTNRERFHFQFLLAKQLDTPAIAITTAISFAFASQTEALDGVFATSSKSIDGGESLP